MGRTFVAVLSSLLISGPLAANAQPADTVGVRAQGMGGAFTAVADDATATWWNPAGLATGAFFNMNVEYGQSRPSARDHLGHGGFAVAFPALGLSYYRMTVSEIRPPDSTGASNAGRQEVGTLALRSVEVSQFGATVGQSIGDHLVLASTFRIVNGGGDTEGDFDFGAMAAFGLMRAGVTVRNVREVDLPSGDGGPVTLSRQVRAGVALTTATRSSFGGVSVAVDADMMAVPTAVGDERRIAVGGELWSRGRTIGGRGGFSASTLGDSRAAASGGVSVAVKRGIYLDGQLTGGSDPIRKGWSAAFRVTF